MELMLLQMTGKSLCGKENCQFAWMGIFINTFHTLHPLWIQMSVRGGCSGSEGGGGGRSCCHIPKSILGYNLFRGVI